MVESKSTAFKGVLLTITHVFSTSKALLKTNTACLALALLASTAPIALAQTEVNSANTSTASLSLPDSPGFLASSESSSSYPDFGTTSDASDPVSSLAPAHHNKLFSHREITIEPGQAVPRLSAQNKVVLGLEQSFTLFSVVGWVTSAGYSQLVNGSPNYGTDSGAFGMRLGATALRNTSQNILGNAIFAPIFHEDPRYYKMGKGHNPVKRTLYAATRALITRSDDGTPRPNYSLISGNLVGSILTNTYYPQLNQGFGQTALTFGTSIGGSAIGFVVSEFLYDGLEYAHLQKLE
jgi:hypothetical protein